MINKDYKLSINKAVTGSAVDGDTIVDLYDGETTHLKAVPVYLHILVTESFTVGTVLKIETLINKQSDMSGTGDDVRTLTTIDLVEEQLEANSYVICRLNEVPTDFKYVREKATPTGTFATGKYTAWLSTDDNKVGSRP